MSLGPSFSTASSLTVFRSQRSPTPNLRSPGGCHGPTATADSSTKIRRLDTIPSLFANTAILAADRVASFQPGTGLFHLGAGLVRGRARNPRTRRPAGRPAAAGRLCASAGAGAGDGSRELDVQDGGSAADAGARSGARRLPELPREDHYQHDVRERSVRTVSLSGSSAQLLSLMHAGVRNRGRIT